MSQIEKESLSALLDNEADDLELRRSIKSCEQDAELRATWERYNLAQALMHGAAVAVNPELSKRIALQIQSEAPPVKRVNWQRSMVKLAVAASVALIFIVAMQTTLNNDTVPTLVEQSSQQLEPGPGLSLPSTPIVVEDVAFEVDPAKVQYLYDYIGTRYLDKEEPLHTEHIQDSPFFRLVNELQPKP